MSDPAFLELGYDTAIALTVLGLLVPGVFVWIFPQRIGRRRQMIVNVVVGSSFIGSWLILRLLQSGPTDLLILVLLAGLHGVFWSIWYMRLAFTFHEKARKAQLLSVLAAATSIPGIVLALQSQISKLIAVTEVAWYALFIGMQNLMTFMYLCREGRAEADSEAGRVLHLLPMAKPSRVPLTARSVNRGESIDEGLRVSAD